MKIPKSRIAILWAAATLAAVSSAFAAQHPPAGLHPQRPIPMGTTGGSFDTGGSAQQPVDLGTLGGAYSVGMAINVKGTVAGSASLAGEVATHAFRVRDFDDDPGGMITDLGVLSGGTNSSAAGISNTAQVVGQSDYNDPTYGLVQHPFLFVHKSMQDLGTLGGSIAQATGIDNSGCIVGYSLLNDQATTHGFLYNLANSSISDLGTLSGGVNSQAFGIVNCGLVAGSSDTGNVDATGSPITDAVIWDLNKHQIHDLGTLGGSFAQATSINNSGVAAGYSTTTSGQTDPFMTRGTTLTDLGNLGGSYAQATGISDAGLVVGFSNITGDTDVHAFVWSAQHGLVDLNYVLPANSGWELSAAYGINASGQIVGIGIYNGESHAFALTYSL